MKSKIIFDNKIAIILYWLINVLLFLTLITLIILYFREILIIPREYFVLIIGIHLAFVFWFSVHYVCIQIDETRKVVIVEYLKRFKFQWKRQLTHTEISFEQYGGVDYNSGFTASISFYKIEQGEKYILGPLSLGIMFPHRLKTIESRLNNSTGFSPEDN